MPALPAPRRVARAGGASRRSRASATSRTGAGRCRASATRTARILIIGLAPAAHGGNRTGRVFTGDKSGDFLWAALHGAGLADRPSSRRADDGLTLTDAYIAAAVRCAPPLNKPTNDERDACAPFLAREIALLTELRVILALGTFGWDAALRALEDAGPSGRAQATVRARRVESRSGRTGSSARTTRASRTRSPAG